MTTIITRAGKGSPLTNNEVDANFNNLNSDKVETSRAINSGTGLTGGGNLTADRTLALTGQALAVHNLATNGLVARTAANTVAARTLTGTTDQITVTNGDGVSGNPTIAAVIASQAEAEAGTDTTKLMTPQRVSQAAILKTGGTMTGNLTVPSINNGPLAGFRNAIINGNFDIWQRGTSFSNPAAGSYTVDRWALSYNGTGATRTLSRQSFTLGQTDVPNEPTYFFRFAQSVAGSGATFNSFFQTIEGVRTFATKQVTLSFYAKAAASLTLPEIYIGQHFGTGGSPSSTVFTIITTNQVITTSWAKYTYTITVPSISGKTIGSDNNDHLSVQIGLPINTTFTFDLAQVQVEAGPVATPFERRPIGTELALCQRYYQIEFAGSLENATASAIRFGGPFIQTMRTSPTLTKSGTGSLSAVDANGWTAVLGSGQTVNTTTASAEL